MRSTRTSAAWAAVAMTTSLLGVTIVGAQSQRSVATSGVARGVTLPKSNLYALTSTSTLFYLVDHDLDTLVPISNKNATGANSPITGGVFDIAVVPRP